MTDVTDDASPHGRDGPAGRPVSESTRQRHRRSTSRRHRRITLAVVAGVGRPARRRRRLASGSSCSASVVVMIFLHELGHFIAGREAGMKVTEFFLGFGPRLWCFQRGETEYGVKAIPARRLRPHHRHAQPRRGRPRTRPAPTASRATPSAWRSPTAGSAMHFLHGARRWCSSCSPSSARPEALFTQANDFRIKSTVDGDSAAQQAGIQPGDGIVVHRRRADRLVHRSSHDVVVPRQGKQVADRRSAVTASRSPKDVTIGESDGHGFLGVEPQAPPIATSRRPVTAARSHVHRARLHLEADVRLLRVVLLAVRPRRTSRTRSSTAVTRRPSLTASPASNADVELRLVARSTRTGRCRSSVPPASAARSSARARSRSWRSSPASTSSIGMFNLFPLLPLDGGHAAIADLRATPRSRKGRPYHADVDEAHAARVRSRDGAGRDRCRDDLPRHRQPDPLELMPV